MCTRVVLVISFALKFLPISSRTNWSAFLKKKIFTFATSVVAFRAMCESQLAWIWIVLARLWFGHWLIDYHQPEWHYHLIDTLRSNCCCCFEFTSCIGSLPTRTPPIITRASPANNFVQTFLNYSTHTFLSYHPDITSDGTSTEVYVHY